MSFRAPRSSGRSSLTHRAAERPPTRRQGRAAALTLLGVLGLAFAGCGSSSSSSSPPPAAASPSTVSRVTSTASHTTSSSAAPAIPVVLPAAGVQGNVGWTPVVSIGGQTAAWLSRVPGEGEPITMLRFDQGLTRLALHSGSMDPGGSGWQYGDSIGPAEQPKVVAGFQGGFKLLDDVGGFLSQGRLEHPLSTGRASIVTYISGQSDVGAWRSEVPAIGQAIFSVRQNLYPLIDHGQAASNVSSCVIACWGPTLGGGLASARGALGIDSAGRLIYAGGERLTVSALAGSLVSAGVQRAAELDINPEWVNLYLFRHEAGGSIGIIPMIPGQPGIPGQLLMPYNRDFFTVVVR